MRKIRNQELGILPPSVERSVFQKRLELINSLSDFGQLIVYEFENFFTPNNTFGYSFANILERVIDAYAREVANTALAPESRVGFMTPEYNIMTSSLSGFSTRNSKIKLILEFISERYYASPTSFYTIFGNTKVWGPGVWKITPPNYTENTTPNTLKVGMYNEDNSERAYLYAQYSTGTNFTTVNKANVQIDVQDPSFYLGKTLRMFKREYCYSNYADGRYYPATTFIFSRFTPTTFIKMLRDTVSVIRYLESEIFAIEIRGNVDGVKVDAYEQLLSDQLSRLNNLTDVVQSSLNNEKINFQTKKDELTTMIEKRKLDLQNAINSKREEIAKMSKAVASYSTDLESMKQEISMTYSLGK